MNQGITEAAFGLAFEGMSVDEVLALREGLEWKHFKGSSADRFADLLSIEVLDAHLRTDGARTPRIAMADEARSGSAGVPEAEFALPDGRVDLPSLLARFDQGASLVVSQFHETHPPLARFCRGLERLFLHAVQSNIYLTPPAAQGFRTHFDTHDVLVLQVDGRKRWRIWDGERIERPTRRTPWPGNMEPVGEPHVVILEPGDSLYIPRGVMHDAATEPGGRSLHATIGFMENSWAQAIRALVDEAELFDAGLRESLPSWRIGEADLLPALAEKLSRLATAAHAERLANLTLEQLARDRQPLPARGLFAPLPEGPLRLTEGMHTHLAQGDDGSSTLFWTGGALPLSAAEAAELMALAEGAEPGESGFARKLWGMGLLEPA
ncbi:cupin domain-containing protein [Sediminicoccus sp. KRV36]|uniref:cupin domain-containing protein n=1 Tax=Sediminicoccus sp. KRV36 TaxID=3133721 RepID=UPI00200C5397|nr:cupin domain-containing protein [Sediminicoccus rosea]UPY37659.1 cupin domain-containing protein [Sediminicoccus rosea]